MVPALRTLLLVALFFAAPGCEKKPAGRRIVAPARTTVAHTGSMVPTFKGGESIYVAPVAIASVKEGDIIVYWEEARQLNILHRVVRVIHAANGETGLLCRGDANPARDLHIVTAENLVGIVRQPVPILAAN